MPLLKRSKRLARACMSCRTSTPPIQPGVLYLCSAYPVRDGDEPGTIGLGRIRPIVGNDWGWWRTVTLNLDHITALASGNGQRLVPAGGKYHAVEQLALLSKAIETAPKSLRWKARAKVGERVRWYEIPEETAHH